MTSLPTNIVPIYGEGMRLLGDEYAAWLRGRGYADRTISQRRILLENRLSAWGALTVEAETIAGWLTGYSGWSRLTYHTHLTSIFEWLIERGDVGVNPMVQIRRPPAPRPAPRPLLEHDLTRALADATPRGFAYLMLGYLAGLRAHEIAKFHGRDLTSSHVRVVGKGGSTWSLPTHPLLWELSELYPRDGYWFPSSVPTRQHIRSGAVSSVVSRLFRSLGIAGSSHRARHTYATKLLRGGANLRVVQELMRHRSLTSTAAYLGVDEDERRTAIASLAA